MGDGGTRARQGYRHRPYRSRTNDRLWCTLTRVRLCYICVPSDQNYYCSCRNMKLWVHKIEMNTAVTGFSVTCAEGLSCACTYFRSANSGYELAIEAEIYVLLRINGKKQADRVATQMGLRQRGVLKKLVGRHEELSVRLQLGK